MVVKQHQQRISLTGFYGLRQKYLNPHIGVRPFCKCLYLYPIHFVTPYLFRIHFICIVPRPREKCKPLSLHRPQQGSFGKVFLQEGIYDDDGNSADADDRVFDRVGRHLRILGQALGAREAAHGQYDDLP